ncbi:MAG TPA: molybdopterin cofactor-binding domain-containing protein, partial [Steroidobacteraceae bacterium]|nr:molybdopterin cofactor-binding domain-containing protein [Steroidobacteraceae bacterium]
PGGGFGGFGGAQPLNPSAYIKIMPDGKITLYSKTPEIGQGMKTGNGLMLAEELDANWNDVVVEQAPINSAMYGQQFAGGSMSLSSNWNLMRQSGAAARAMLVSAAAQQWGVPESEITTSNSTVMHAASNRKASYGSLATAAAALPVPAAASLKLKDKKDWKLFGKRTTGVDNPKVVTGQPLFGMDITERDIPGLKVAVFQKCPAVGGKVASANLDEIRKLPGVVDAFIVEGTGQVAQVMPGVAIVANNTWSAFSAKKKLKIEWDESNASKDSWTAFQAQAKDTASRGPGAQALGNPVGDFDATFNGAAKKVEGFYTFNFISHQPMEPQNTTAWYQKDPEGDKLEIWGSVQIPDGGRTSAAQVTGVKADRAVMHQNKVGGGFGRRLMNDFVCEAAAISKQAGGIPVKLVWTREDDISHDFYRSGGFHDFKGALDKDGKLIGWSGHVISFSDGFAAAAPAGGGGPGGGFGGRGRGPQAVQGGGWPGATDFPAQYVPNFRLTQTLFPLKIPCGPMRAPGNNTAAWLVQSFMHELSTAAGRDHAEFLIEVFGQKQAPPPAPAGGFGGFGGGFGAGGVNPERAVAVIKGVVERSGWGKPLPKGHYQGLAFHFSHNGHFAEVAEISVDAKKKVTLHKMTVVADIGPIVNLSAAENQVQGSVIEGLSTLGLEVNVENGRIKEQNFDSYHVARMGIAPPVIDVHFLDTDYNPTGCGEPGYPPAIPALTNAIYAATKHRIRTLPITREGFTIT